MRPYAQRPPPFYRWLAQFVGHVYVIEGNIGSGKTTLGAVLAGFVNENGHRAVFLEEEYPDDVLRDFIAFGHANPGAKNPHAFRLQTAILKRRRDVYVRALALAAERYIVFVDRSLPGDYVFASVNHSHGNIDDAEWHAYLREYRAVDLLEPTAVVYLDTSVEACLARIRQRNRAGESHYTPAYIGALHGEYDTLMRDMDGLPTLILPWDTPRDFDDTAQCTLVAARVFRALHDLLYHEDDVAK